MCACGRGDSGIALLKRYTLVRVQPGVPRRGRSMEGRRSLKPSTLVRFQPSAPRFVLAWCTVHWRIYKPLRSRSEHGLGSTPSASTMRSKLIRMSSRFLIGRQLVRFQQDAPNLRNCGRMVRRSTFNRDGESSILSSSTNEIVCRRRLVARIADLQSADGSSILLAGAMSRSSNGSG